MVASRVNQEIIAGDRVVVNLDRAESAIVVALDEQADRDHNRFIKLKRVNNPPLGRRHGRVVSSLMVKPQHIERRLEDAGIVLSLRDSRLLRSGGAIQPRLVVELEDDSDKNESAEREYVRDDANATWRLSTMDVDVSVFTSDVDKTTGDVLSNPHSNNKLWLKRSSETEFRRTSEYEMLPEATEASLRAAASTSVPASAPATSAAEEEDSDDDLVNPTEDDLRDRIAQLKAENAELRGGEGDADAASSDEARPRATLSQIRVGRLDDLRYGPDPEKEAERWSNGWIMGGSVKVPMKPPKLKFVFYSMTLHKDAISLVPEVTWPPFEEMLPKSISDAPAPLDVSKTLDKNKARGLLEDLLTRVLPVFAADGSDDMALLAQAHHLSPVFLHYLDPLLKNIARTLYDGIKDAAQSVGGSQPEITVTAKPAQAELLKHPKALLKGDPKAEEKCDAALGVFMPPVRGKFERKRQTLKSLCKHQCAFHMVYGADASPTALDGPSEEWFEQKEGEDYLRPKIVFEDKSDIESDEVVKEFARRDALITAGGFPVNLVTLAVPMEDEPQVPRVPSTSYSSTSDATIVKLRKEIRNKANKRERELREKGFDPTAMNTV